jgi:hypothetical protein
MGTCIGTWKRVADIAQLAMWEHPAVRSCPPQRRLSSYSRTSSTHSLLSNALIHHQILAFPIPTAFAARLISMPNSTSTESNDPITYNHSTVDIQSKRLRNLLKRLQILRCGFVSFAIRRVNLCYAVCMPFIDDIGIFYTTRSVNH